MKKYLIYFFYLLLLFLLQNAAETVFVNGHFLVPWLVLLFIIAFAMSHSLTESLWFAFVAGFFLELFSAQFFGAQIFSVVLISLAVYFVTRHLTTQDISVTTAGIFPLVATGIYGLLILAYSGVIGIFRFSPFLTFGEVYTLRIFWTFVVNLIFFYPVRFIFRFLPK